MQANLDGVGRDCEYLGRLYGIQFLDVAQD
jgi:hypothetical protein